MAWPGEFIAQHGGHVGGLAARGFVQGGETRAGLD